MKNPKPEIFKQKNAYDQSIVILDLFEGYLYNFQNKMYTREEFGERMVMVYNLLSPLKEFISKENWK